jgi:hypothetical protein
MMLEASGSQTVRIHERAERHPRDGWKLAEPLPLSRSSERALRGVVRVLLPAHPAPRTPEIERRVELHVRSMLRYMPVAIRAGFILVLHLLEWSPVWRLRAFSRLSSLPLTKASSVISGLTSSRLLLVRLTIYAPKATILSTYFDQEEVHAHVEYDPRPFIRERIVERGRLLRMAAPEREAEIAAHP